MKRYVFGGAFDPPTAAHAEIIKTIASIMDKEKDQLIILITNNDEKSYHAPAAERMAMLEILLTETPTGIERDKIRVAFQHMRMADQLKSMTFDEVTPENTTVCIGLDQAEAIARGLWKDSDKIIEMVSFLVFSRTIKTPLVVLRDQLIYKAWEKAKYQIVPISSEGISSTAIRHNLESNPFMAMTLSKTTKEVDLMTFRSIYFHIFCKGLYGQNGPDFDNEMDAFLENYTKEKTLHIEWHKEGADPKELQEEMDKKFKEFMEQNGVSMEIKGYPEPSVTADIVAYTPSEEVLLIRRKNYPYKNYWALPGGFFDLADRDIAFTAARELKEETKVDLPPNVFRQIKTYAHCFDPRLRVVDVAFSVRIPPDQEDRITGADDAAEAKLWPIYDLPEMAFHHKTIIQDFLDKQRKH